MVTVSILSKMCVVALQEYCLIQETARLSMLPPFCLSLPIDLRRTMTIA